VLFKKEVESRFLGFLEKKGGLRVLGSFSVKSKNG